VRGCQHHLERGLAATRRFLFGIGINRHAQIQKETTVNEGFASLDLALCAATDGFLANTPPANPVVGSCYIVGDNPTGAWAGHARGLAGFAQGGWRFVAPFEGLTSFDKGSGEFAIFTSGAWERGHVRAAKVSVGGNQVVGARLAAIADPMGGTSVDVEARAAIGAILARLRQHGLIAT